MHVGYVPVFQNPDNRLPDREVYLRELALAELAEPLGFDSIWSVEHHFTDYTMVPDVLQFLTYMAGRTQRALLGSMVVVLPWHDPVRVAEQVALLDHLSGGRFVLGIGRGLGRVEFEGFRVDMNDSRGRFVEFAEMVLRGLEDGYVEYDGEHVTQPRRDIRPLPFRSFRGRTFAAAMSPETMPIVARLGAGVLIIPQKPWDLVAAELANYRAHWDEANPGIPVPRPLMGTFVYVNADPAIAEERAHQYIGGYYHSVLKHYEMTAGHFAGTRGYEYYSRVTKYINRHGTDGAATDFTRLMPWGTPDQLLRKLEEIRGFVDYKAVMAHFSFAGMPYDMAEESMRLFAAEVLPVVQAWESEPLDTVEAMAAAAAPA